ncbi:NACHT domain- and WD repeat-containing protein 1 [Notamacropus eugenii]|uniref:NACHT domain- and WD repeat-containing protein 1 n=1 Tax=Notamacropus eugenii TaxID=9315 RepID=UPI003B6779C8
MNAERETLLGAAYPEVQTFCQKHGLMLEVVDLRWGLPTLEAVDHTTTDLCLEEIAMCQKLSAGPTFIALMGDQYGHCPIPRLIEEKEFQALCAQLTKSPNNLTLLAQWFWKDDNAVPPVYILQPITTHLPQYQKQHHGDCAAWKKAESSLATALRSAAQEAERQGLISREQKLRYHKSVIEWEIEHGLLNIGSGDGDLGATIFLREIRDLNKHILDECNLPMVDLQEDGCLDMEAQNFLTSLKVRITDNHPKLLKVHFVQWSQDLVNPKNRTHAKYLKELGEQFIATVNHQILERLRCQNKGHQMLGPFFQELHHHMAQCKDRCQVFCGREELLSRIGKAIAANDGTNHTPLVVLGLPGVGKTTVLCKISEHIQDFLGQKTVLVLRLLGTSQASSNICLLLNSICLQVCLAYGLPPPPAGVMAVYSGAVQFFQDLLFLISSKNVESLVLILDAVGELNLTYGARGLTWLPKKCPPKVHLILSACSVESGILKTMQEMVTSSEAYFEVKPLSGEQGQKMIELLLASVRRKLSPVQRDLLWASLPECGHPLRLKLAFDEAQRWASYTLPVSLATTAQQAMHQLCARLEELHGQVLVSHVLGYIVTSRYGLSEAELKDVLSLDDEVLMEVYQEWTPPSKDVLRFPPLLWARLRRDLGNCLVKRPADGFMLLGLAYRQLTDVVKERYLSGQEKTKRHHLLSEFFTGAWSQGIKKPITLPLLGKPLNVDRKVAPQPLWFSDTVANLRKLSELPIHLANSGRTEELKKDVLGNMDWISCRVVSSGITSMLEDFALCAEHIDCPELNLIRDAIQLSRPTIDCAVGMDKIILYTEILARLYSFSSLYPSFIGQLCHQCLRWFDTYPHPVLIPLCGFLLPPGGPLQETLTGYHKGITAIEWSSNNKLLIIGSQNGTLVVWSMQERESQVVHILTGHTGEVRCVKTFGQGNFAISASKDCTLRAWNLVSGKEKYVIQDGVSFSFREPHFCCLHVDEKNKVVYSASGSKVNAWNLETAKAIFHIVGDAWNPWLWATVFPSSSGVVTVSKEGLVSTWDARTGKYRSKHNLSSLKEETLTSGTSLQKQGQIVVGSNSGSLLLISPQGSSLLEKVPSAVQLLVVSEDESLLAAGFGRYVRVFLADSKGFHRFMATDLEHENTVEAAVIGSDNNVIVTGSLDAFIQVWSLSEQGTLLDIFDGMGTPVNMFACCGHTLVSASRNSSSFRVWDLAYTRKHKLSSPFLDRTGCAAVSHNGNYVYFPKIGDKSKITVWDSVEGEDHDILDASNEVWCLEVAEQMKLLFAGLISGTVLVFPLNSRQDVMCIPPPEAKKPVKCMALSRGEERLVIAYDNIVLVMDIRPEDPCPVIDGPTYTFYTQLPAMISSIAVLTNYRVVYGMTNGEVFIYECAKSKVFPLEAPQGKVTCLEVSHKEQWAVSSSQESLLYLWDLELCKWKHTLTFESAFYQGIQCVCFSNDDKYVYSGLKDQSILVWNVSDGFLLAVQFVSATVNKMISTADGFIATTRHGYLIRERFHCPQPISASYDPLKNIKAACTIKTKKHEDILVAVTKQQSDSEKMEEKQNSTNKISQVCVVI